MNLYNSIETAIREHKGRLPLEDAVQESDVRQAIRWIMRDNPDIFWFVHQYRYNEETRTLFFRYQYSPERTTLIQKSIDEVVKRDFQLDYVLTLNEFEQVAYVYKWILSYCNYNYNSAFNQNIDSVFVHRNSVCVGYAKAAQYLLKLLGIESRIVFGRLNNDAGDGRHCWNIVIIGNQPYHLDVCLGDVALETLLKKSGAEKTIRHQEFNYNCFCVSTEEIVKTRVVEDLETLPSCGINLDAEKVEALSRLAIKKSSSHIGCLVAKNGSSADIHLCLQNKKVVYKKFRSEADNRKCLDEYRFMRKLQGCPHLLQLNDALTDIPNNLLAIEQSTPLVNLLCCHYYHPTFRSVLTMIRDVILGWEECLSRGIWYRDLHICNIFKSDDGTYRLGDFGNCAEDNRISESVGSPWFMAPETYHDGNFDEKSAVYSITSILYFILNNYRPPFVEKNDLGYALNEIMTGTPLPRPSLLSNIPDHLADAIMDLLAKGHAASRDIRMSSTTQLLAEINHLLETTGTDFTLSHTQAYSDDILPTHVSISRAPWHKIATRDTDEWTTDAATATSPVSIKFAKTAAPREDIETFATTAAQSMNYDVLVEDIEEHGATRKRPLVSYLPYLIPTFERRFALTPKYSRTLVYSKSSRFGSFFRGLKSHVGLFKKKKNPEYLEAVYSSVFAPAEIAKKSWMIVQVYLHRFDETEKVASLAKEAQKEAERRGYIPLHCALKEGDKVDIQLLIYGENILSSENESVVWKGRFTKCSFEYLVPENINTNELFCKTILKVNNLPVGEMSFTTKIEQFPRRLHSAVATHQYQKVFISYSHVDEEKVKFLAEGFKVLNVDYFFDRQYLKTGDIYPQAIKEYIDKADLFILCWSENASKSDYVQKERKQALSRAYPAIKPPQAAKLSIYPLSIEPHAELPADIADYYQFGFM